MCYISSLSIIHTRSSAENQAEASNIRMGCSHHKNEAFGMRKTNTEFVEFKSKYFFKIWVGKGIRTSTWENVAVWGLPSNSSNPTQVYPRESVCVYASDPRVWLVTQYAWKWSDLHGVIRAVVWPSTNLLRGRKNIEIYSRGSCVYEEMSSNNTRLVLRSFSRKKIMAAAGIEPLISRCKAST